MSNSTDFTPVASHDLETALDYVRNGGTLIVPTYTRTTVIKAKNVNDWEAVGLPLIREDGEGFRMRTGRKSSVYLFAGQLRYD